MKSEKLKMMVCSRAAFIKTIKSGEAVSKIFHYSFFSGSQRLVGNPMPMRLCYERMRLMYAFPSRRWERDKAAKKAAKAMKNEK